MDFIQAIDNRYEGNILLNPPYEGERPGDIPEEIYEILCISNGIMETMLHPNTGERLSIGWIIYPDEMMREESSFYREEYGIEGVVFATDGAGDPYIFKPDGRIIRLDPTCGEEAEEAGSLREFYEAFT